MIVSELRFLDGEIRVLGTSVFQSEFSQENGWAIRIENGLVYLSADVGIENGYLRPEVPEFVVANARVAFRPAHTESPEKPTPRRRGRPKKS